MQTCFLRDRPRKLALCSKALLLLISVLGLISTLSVAENATAATKSKPSKSQVLRTGNRACGKIKTAQAKLGDFPYWEIQAQGYYWSNLLNATLMDFGVLVSLEQRPGSDKSRTYLSRFRKNIHLAYDDIVNASEQGIFDKRDKYILTMAHLKTVAADSNTNSKKYGFKKCEFDFGTLYRG